MLDGYVVSKEAMTALSSRLNEWVGCRLNITHYFVPRDAGLRLLWLVPPLTRNGGALLNR